MLLEYSVENTQDLPEAPTPKWALYLPNIDRYKKNFRMYRTKGHAKSALKGFYRASKDAQVFEWVDNAWVERNIDEFV